MVRRFFVWLHRWAGLLMTAFLILVGLTGSVLAFREEIDVWLNPRLLSVAKRDAPLLDGLALREKAAVLYPDDRFDDVPLLVRPDRSVQFSRTPGMKGGDHVMERMVEFFLDPYTGEMLGERPVWSGPSMDRKNIISFLYRLHFALASPFEGWYVGDHSVGAFILGITALVWTIDCFVGFYLTFPLRMHVAGDGPDSSKSWWRRWKPAWLIKPGAGAIRINFDIHRAFGLWTWILLFVFAWSSVAMNLNEVYAPTMKFIFGTAGQSTSEGPPASPVEAPVLGFREAYARGSFLLRAEALRRRVAIEREVFLSLDRDAGVYRMGGRRAGELTKSETANVVFDANTGVLREASFPGDSPRNSGDAITSWLIWVHLAAVFGLPMQILVCFMGLVITALSITGVYIWLKKRAARRLALAARRPLERDVIA